MSGHMKSTASKSGAATCCPSSAAAFGPRSYCCSARSAVCLRRRAAISHDYKVYNSEEIQIEGDPTSFEEEMESANSSKWFAAMEDEMKSMSTNKV